MSRKATSVGELWRQNLVEDHRKTRVARMLFGHIPSAPRCKICQNPFGGRGGRMFKAMGFKPSRKNPTLCVKCCDALPEGGAEVDAGIVFADVRGSTALGESMSATDYADHLNRFYKVVTKVLVDHDAVIDKLIGDEVMAIFVPGGRAPSTATRRPTPPWSSPGPCSTRRRGRRGCRSGSGCYASDCEGAALRPPLPSRPQVRRSRRAGESLVTR